MVQAERGYWLNAEDLVMPLLHDQVGYMGFGGTEWGRQRRMDRIEVRGPPSQCVFDRVGNSEALTGKNYNQF